MGRPFEGWIASEIVKAQSNAGRRRDLYYYGDQQQVEVDFVVPGRRRRLAGSLRDHARPVSFAVLTAPS